MWSVLRTISSNIFNILETPVDAYLSSWSDWTNCTELGTCVRRGACREGSYGGRTCADLGTDLEEAPCPSITSNLTCFIIVNICRGEVQWLLQDRWCLYSRPILHWGKPSKLIIIFQFQSKSIILIPTLTGFLSSTSLPVCVSHTVKLSTRQNILSLGPSMSK